MDPLVLAGLITGGLGLVGDMFNIGQQNRANITNERLMRESWAREDNAVQRRVRDLTAAGMSPVLAAGQGASSSGPISVKPLQSNFKMDVPALLAMKTQIEKTKADTDIARTALESMPAGENASTVAASTAMKSEYEAKRSFMDYQRSNVELQDAKNRKDSFARDFNMAKEYGVPTNSANAMDAITNGRLLDKLIGKEGNKGGILYSLLLGALKAR